MNKHVVIIGSGLGGLSCGVILAKNGFRVTILEKNPRIGGCLQCFYRDGVKFETGMHFIGSAERGEILYKILHYLGIYDSLPLAPLDSASYNVVSLLGKRYNFANKKEPFIEQMASYFPSQREALYKYYDLVESISATSALNTLKNGSSNIANIEYQLRSINNVLEEIISDPTLQNVLVGDLPLYAAERDKTPFSIHAFIMDFYNKSSFRVAGGSDIVATLLAEQLKRYGGEILTNMQASKVICNQSRATAVECKNGEKIEADYVISAIHPKRSVELLSDCPLLRPIYKRRIISMPQTIGAFSLYICFKEKSVKYMNHNFFGYRVESPWECQSYKEEQWPKGYLYMHGCDSLNQEFARAGMVISYMDIKDLEQWSNTTTGKRGEEYREYMNSHAERLIAVLEQDFPNIRGCIAGYYTSSPLSYRDYTGTEEGSLYGVAKDITPGNMGRVSHRTRIPNLFFAGQNVNSHGILGVIVGSVVTCGEFLTSDYLYKQIMESTNE